MRLSGRRRWVDHALPFCLLLLGLFIHQHLQSVENEFGQSNCRRCGEHMGRGSAGKVNVVDGVVGERASNPIGCREGGCCRYSSRGAISDSDLPQSSSSTCGLAGGPQARC